MQPHGAFISGFVVVLLSIVIGEERRASAAAAAVVAKMICPKAALAQAIGNLHNKTATWRHTLPKDRIKDQKLLDKELRTQFMTHCVVQDQLLTFYQKQVFGGLHAGSVPESILNTFDEIKKNLRKCLSCAVPSADTSPIKQLKDRFDKIKDRGHRQRRTYKAISEITVLISWLNTFLSQ